MKRIGSWLLAGLVALAGPAVAADKEEARERLRAFTEDLQSFRANFEQTLYDEEEFPIRESSGVAMLEKPGKFRWQYQEPNEKLLVSDGGRMWMYEADLEQVTVREYDEALGRAPIALLSGNTGLDEQFDIRPLGEREDLHWVELKPKVKDTDFRSIYLGFDGTSLKAMELRDRFDGATQVVFSDVEVNPDIAADRFEFTPPEGADVMGDAAEDGG